MNHHEFRHASLGEKESPMKRVVLAVCLWPLAALAVGCGRRGATLSAVGAPVVLFLRERCGHRPGSRRG
jgi:hypothetical protein